MRPRSVRAFEQLFLLSLLLAVVQAVVGWEELSRRGSKGEMLAVLGLSIGTLAGLTLLVSRGRSRSAKWVMTLLLLIGLPLFVMSGVEGTLTGSPWLALVQAALQAGSLALLITREARQWLQEK